MSSRFLNATGAAAIAAMLALSVQTSSAQITFPWERSPQGSPQVQAQSDDADLEMRIQRLENQLRQLTGQNEELQYRNRQLEDRLRQLGAAPSAPGGQPPVAQPNVAAAPPPVQPGGRRRDQGAQIVDDVPRLLRGERLPVGRHHGAADHDVAVPVAVGALAVQLEVTLTTEAMRRGDFSELLDPANPLAFVTGLTFAGSGQTTLAMTPITAQVPGVPEPSVLLLFSLSAIVAGRRYVRARRA